jgi:fagellar hook-basal body proteins
LGNASNLSLTYTKTASNAWGMSTSIPSGASNIVLSGSRETHGDTASDVYYAAGQLEFSGIPSNGSTITITSGGKEYTFEFLSTKGAHAQPGNIGVDISTGIASASDFANKFLEALQANMPGANRFSANGNKIEIVQSVSGEALQIDASKTLACIQSAANPNLETGIATGIFDIPAIDEDIKNCGRLDFTSNDKADYVNTTVKVGDKTYKFVDGTTTTPGEIDISSAFDGSAANPAAAVAELLVKSIKADSVEPERFTASGSSIEILPSSTGPDIKITVNNTGGGDAITGRIRSTAPLGWSDVANGTEYTLSNTFNVNDNEIETGSIVPSVRFNADGTPKYFFVDEVSIQWANGAQNMDGGYQQGTTITLNAGNVGTNDGLTSLSGDFTTNYITQDGAKFGSYSGVSISEDGVVTALFDNGETRPIAILPLATFANPNGMEALTGNSWIETDYSGQAMLKQAGTNGAGQISSNSLEQSTVDLATEFSNMIVTQRAYSAATKIITTADEMLDELTRMS